MPDILHIGIHKTASTYLQNAIWPQVEGVQYLSRPFTQHNHAFNALQYGDDSLFDLQQIQAVLAEFRNRRFLVSDEGLSGKPMLFGSVNRSQIARRLSAVFPNATVVVFIRDQRDILLSHYNSYIKEPVGTKTLREFLWKPAPGLDEVLGVREDQYFNPSQFYYNPSDFHLHLDSFLYTALIGVFQSLFENVEVFLYEDLNHRPEEVLQRLSRIVGQPLQQEKRSWNRSYSHSELVLRRSLNRLRPLAGDVFVKGLSRALGGILPGGSKDAWRREVQEIVGDYYTADNRLLKKMCPTLPWERYEDKYV